MTPSETLEDAEKRIAARIHEIKRERDRDQVVGEVRK